MFKTDLNPATIDQKGTVLIVSNEPGQFISTADSLRREGYNVQFRTGRNLTALADENANLIISELAQPELDGLQLCRRISDRYPASPTWVLLVGDLSTGSTIVADSFKCGAAAYVRRTNDPNELSLICLGLLKGHRAVHTGSVRHCLNRYTGRAGVTMRANDHHTAHDQSVLADPFSGSKWNILDCDKWPIDRVMDYSD